VSSIFKLLLILSGIGAGAVVIIALVRQIRLRAKTDYFVGKVVVLTGASRGIGRALAHAFAKAGAHLVLAARAQQQLSDVAAECSAIRPGIQTLVVPTDITNDVHLQNLVDKTAERFGHIDILVNNAGIIQGGAVSDISSESIRQQFEVNVMSAMRLTQMVLSTMLPRQEGHIVFVSSMAGDLAMPYFASYSATKSALHGFADGLRRELAHTGVKATTINPSFTDTEMVEEAGKAWRRMGFMISDVETVAKQSLNGIRLGSAEVNFGLVEPVGAVINTISPELVDLFWNVVAPKDLPQIAARQQTK
jgi:short-subunit dehydrogenase